jgi:N-acetylated-alpha-linked acidic dipeptidase
VPSLKTFLRQVAQSVPSPLGGTVYEQWKVSHPPEDEHRASNAPPEAGDVHVGDLGSGSDYTPFLQHIGVPSTDVGSEGSYGVYHSAFDDFAWFKHNADPHFVYLQQMARVLGLEAVRMADADVLPYDYVAYAREISSYIAAARDNAKSKDLTSLDFAPAQAAASRLVAAAQQAHQLEENPPSDPNALNAALRQTEADFITPAGLPNRPWYRHTIYAPGEYTGYAAVVIPGVNEAIDAHDAARARQQLTVLTQAIDRATRTLQSAP